MWRNGYFLSDKPWQGTDLTADVTHYPLRLPVQAFDYVFFPTQTNRNSVLASENTWQNVADWLASGGVVAAIPDDDHIIDTYLRAANNYTAFFALQGQPYERLGAPFQVAIDAAFSRLRSDVSVWSNGKLRTAPNAAEHIVNPSDVHRALVFIKK